MAKKYKNFYGEEENEIEAFIENALELKEVKHETPILLITEEYKDKEKIVFSEMVYEELDEDIDFFNNAVNLTESVIAKFKKMGLTDDEIK